MEPRARLLLVLLTGVLLGVLLSLWRGRAGRARARGAAGLGGRAGTVLSWEDARLLAEVMRGERHYVERVDEHAMLRNALRGLVGGLDDTRRSSITTSSPSSGSAPVAPTPAYRYRVAAIDDIVAVARLLRIARGARRIEPWRRHHGDRRRSARRHGSGRRGPRRLRGSVGSGCGCRSACAARWRGPTLSWSAPTSSCAAWLPGCSCPVALPAHQQLHRHHRRGVERALEQLQAQRALRGLVIDLRDNPGGVLEARRSPLPTSSWKTASSSAPKAARQMRASAWRRRRAMPAAGRTSRAGERRDGLGGGDPRLRHCTTTAAPC
jgi:hypothetical protein